MADEIKALLLTESDGGVTPAVTTLPSSALAERMPDGDVTVAVDFSTLNYKDGMVVNGVGRLVRSYPHIPGIDYAGTVEVSDNADLAPSQKVILTGWRVGEMHWGGYATKARAKSGWLVPITPEMEAAGLTTKRAMAVGTAGFTAMLCVMALEANGVTPASGDVLVTGAAGGVGSVAVAILAKLGYRVVASTGRESTHDYLRELGAGEIIARDSIATPSGRPLDSERFAGMVDAVGGSTLAAVLPQMAYNGVVAACGLAGGPKLETTVIPFLLRGVRLIGIDSVMQPLENRTACWARIASDLDMTKLDRMIEEASLDDVPDLAARILKGDVRGRTVISPSR